MCIRDSLGLVLVAAVGSVTFATPIGLTQANAEGNVTGVANLIFGKYVWVFEVTSALLIVAALGAMVMAHRERLTPRPTQRQWSERRFRRGKNLAGLPLSLIHISEPTRLGMISYA